MTVDTMIKAYGRMGYKLFDKGDFNLNIFGIRSTKHINKFDDTIGVLYKENGKWVLETYEGTTDPGITSLQNPVNCAGCAILVPGQYRSAFKVGYHKNKYKALVQNTKLALYRDNDRDNKLDCTNISWEMAGINLHHANTSEVNPSVQVDKWSAGCTVIRKISDWNQFIELVEIASEMYGDKFTYTLFTEEEVIGGCQ